MKVTDQAFIDVAMIVFDKLLQNMVCYMFLVSICDIRYVTVIKNARYVITVSIHVFCLKLKSRNSGIKQLVYMFLVYASFCLR